MTRIIQSVLTLRLFFQVVDLVSSFSGWIDPDTSENVKTVNSYTNNKQYDIIMSDEFNIDNRKFVNGFDPMWTSIHKSDDDQTSGGQKSLQFYNETYAYTANGHLNILTTDEDTHWNGYNPYTKKYTKMTRNFRSGMIQSWNKFCFTGGILEIDVQFPGKSTVGGLWPAVWMLGNLGRATYEATTNLMWPWSYDVCDRSLQHAQLLSACAVTEHYGLHRHQGRGATEIDIIETMAGPPGKLPVTDKIQRPYVSQTLQIAPGIPQDKKRPVPMTLPEWGFKWYDVEYGNDTTVNPFFYGTYLGPTKTSEPVGRSKAESYQADAISSLSNLDDSFWTKMNTFRLEWEPGENGYLRWYINGKFTFGIDQSSLNFMETNIPNEPSYIIINTAISTSWGFPPPPPGCSSYDCKNPAGRCGFNAGFCELLPAKFLIDHVRVYQDKTNELHTIGCNPPNYPTRRYIEAYKYNYKSIVDPEPLQKIVTGGASCRTNAHCGKGTCSAFHKCVCSHGWQGPTCRVPTYCNDFPDWDTQGTWLPMYTGPIFPYFLTVCGVALFVAFILVAVFGIYKRKKVKI